MKRACKSALLLVLLLLLVPPQVAGLSATRLTVLHVNDFHGHLLPDFNKTIDGISPVGGAARLARMVADERAKNPDGVLLLSAGDMFQGTPISNVFHGRSVMDFMNYLKFDAMALGNHEFDWGTDILHQLAAAASFPFLAANLQDLHGQGLPLIKSHILLERKGIKLAVIGITTPDTAFTTQPRNVAGLIFQQPAAILPPLVQELRAGGADLIAVLSHSGLDADLAIAAEVSGIDLIIGGHSHTVVTEPLCVNHTIIVQAGSNGAYLGVLDLEIDPSTHKIVDFSRKNELKPVLAAPADPVDEKAAAIVARFNEQIKAAFARTVGETAVDLVRNPGTESNVGNLLADAFREASGADLALLNGGSIRTDIRKGKITLEQVYTLLPFDNQIVTMDLSGAQIRQILEQNASSTHQKLQVSGLTVRYDLTQPAGRQAAEIEVGGQPLEDVRTYRMATNDFLAAGGDAYTTFKAGANLVYGELVRDVFSAYLERKSPVRPQIENRIEITKP